MEICHLKHLIACPESGLNLWRVFIKSEISDSVGKLCGLSVKRTLPLPCCFENQIAKEGRETGELVLSNGTGSVYWFPGSDKGRVYQQEERLIKS